MYTLTTVLLSSILFLSTTWQTDFEKAKAEAKTENKFILLNFSGSDWCGPCIRLRKEIFDSEVFTKYADENLVLVNADFPRLKKNMLSREQQKQNDALADKYNSDGAFPLTLLLDSNGKVIKKWNGFPSGTAEEFTNDVKAAADANH
ncbi:MAG TPA: thioredoxin family protein [Parafilimonas sp.]|nr:thioredoxin family protein [Parafilimonas sp.]